MREKYILQHYNALSDWIKKAHTTENFDVMTSLTNSETISFYGEKLLTHNQAFYVRNKKYLRSFAILKVKEKCNIIVFNITLNLYIVGSRSKPVEFLA